MPRLIVSTVLVIVCFMVLGCTEEPPDKLFAPGTDGLNASKLAKPEKLPTVLITIPRPTGLNPAMVPPVFYVTWTAEKTKEVRWILVSTAAFGDSWLATEEYIRNNADAPEWSEWVKYKPHKDEGAGFYPPPQDFGQYVFAVQAKNPPGDVTDIVRGENMSRLLVSQRSTGPSLRVSNRYIGTMLTSVTTTPPFIIDIPSNVEMSFMMTASAEPYGGIVSGYRYGWDIIDPDDDLQWPMEFTPFVGEAAEVPPHTFFAGTHTIYIEVIDNWGYKSRIPVQVNIVPATMDRPLLVVDDWEENSPGWAATSGALPSDEEHDLFWLAMVGSVDGFDRNQDVIEVNRYNVPPLDHLLSYKSVVWNGSAAYGGTTRSATNEILRFRDPNGLPAFPGQVYPTNIIELYMAAGGHVLLSGEVIMTSSVNWDSFLPMRPAYPLIFRYELGGDQDGNYEDSIEGQWGVGEESFPYDGCCLNALDIAYIRAVTQVRRTGINNCPVNTVRTQSALTDGLRTAMPVDIGTAFPTMNLRPETADPGKWYAPERSGLNCDIYNPPYFGDMCDVAELFPERDCFQPIWGNGCLNTGSAVYEAPVAFWTTTYGDRVPDFGGVAARSAVWGFHPVYFNPAEVKTAMDIVLFDEWQLPRKPAALGMWGSPDGIQPIVDDQPGQLMSIYVVYESAADAAAVEFSAPLPSCATGMTYLADMPEWLATTGNSQSGVTVDFGGCLSGTVHVLTIHVFGQGLTPACCYYPVAAHPGSGQVRVMDCHGVWSETGTAAAFINDTGSCSVPVGTNTWSGIRSLD